jgi:hypothetical protein
LEQLEILEQLDPQELKAYKEILDLLVQLEHKEFRALQVPQDQLVHKVKRVQLGQQVHKASKA